MTKHVKLGVFKGIKELWGVNMASVKEIIREPKITPINWAPFFIKGMIILRGKMVLVVDLRKYLGLGAAKRNQAYQVLITENQDKLMGFLLDTPLEVLKISWENIEKPPETFFAMGIEYIAGVTRVKQRAMVLLDLKKILDVEIQKMERETHS